jgi:hypothetical protein
MKSTYNVTILAGLLWAVAGQSVSATPVGDAVANIQGNITGLCMSAPCGSQHWSQSSSAAGTVAGSVDVTGDSAQGSLSLGTGPTPNMSANASLTNYAVTIPPYGTIVIGSNGADFNGTYIYNVIVQGPGPSVLVDITAAGSIAVGPLSAAVMAAHADTSWNIGSAGYTLAGDTASLDFVQNTTLSTTANVSGSTATGFSGGFSGTKVVSLQTNTEYGIGLSLNLDAGLWDFASGNLSLSGMIDPYLSIDPSVGDAGQYSFSFSAGVDNGPTAVPVPASLPLFAGGLAALGLVGWRRNGRARALAA